MFESLADLAVQQVTNILGTPAVFQYQNGGADVSLQAVYQKNREIYETESGVVTGYSESATIRAVDLPTAPKQKDNITINSKLYGITDVEHDGIASYVLYLRLK